MADTMHSASENIVDMQVEVEVPGYLLESWQEMVNLLAEIADVPAALIMRVEHDTIEVFRTSNSEGNPYALGSDEPFHRRCGLYCEYVLRTNDKLLVPDALSDPAWNNNPDVPLGMISYLGFPILFPDATPFGTICILDSKPNAYKYLTDYFYLYQKFKTA
jgi:GAF domain-containing protein